MKHYKTHCWEHEIEPGFLMCVRYEEDAPCEPVSISIPRSKETLNLWPDEVNPLIEMLQKVQATMDQNK